MPDIRWLHAPLAFYDLLHWDNFLQFRFQQASFIVYGSLFIKVTCWLFLKLPKVPVVIGTINNSQFHRRFMLVVSRPGIPQFSSCYLPVIMSTFIVEWIRSVYYCTAFSFLVYNFDVWSVMRSLLMLFFIGTFKTSTFEPGSFSSTHSPVILFNLFPDGWSIQSISY